MRFELFSVILVSGLLLFGCVQPPGGASAKDKPIGEIVKEDVATPTAIASVTPMPTPEASSAQTTSNPPTSTAGGITTASSTPVSTTPSAAPTAQATIAASAPATQEFSTEMDDNGWYPDSITVKAGVPLVIHDTLRTTNVYFGGGRAKSVVLAQPVTFSPGDQKDLAFTPTQSVCIGNYWPASDVLKGYLKVNVDGMAPASC